MEWKTVRDNGMSAIGPTGHSMDLRIVFDDIGGDVAYVVPDSDNDNGNKNARKIAAAPELLKACMDVWDAFIEWDKSDPDAYVPDAVSNAVTKCGVAICIALVPGYKEVTHGR